MRARIVSTVLRREWSETVRNRLMSTHLLPPPGHAPTSWPGSSASAPFRLELATQAAQRPGGATFTRPSWPGRSQSSSSWRSSC